jgi:hypothetical protein
MELQPPQISLAWWPQRSDECPEREEAHRFYKPQLINGMMASADGPIKTFPLRGIKDSPPYMHDGRLLTREDTVEVLQPHR